VAMFGVLNLGTFGQVKFGHRDGIIAFDLVWSSVESMPEGQIAD